MAISRITGQDGQGNAVSGNTVSATYPGSTTAGDLLIAVAAFNSGASTTISISGWTSLISIEQATGTDPAALFYKLATGSESTITATTTGSSTYSSISICEYTGNANPIVTDGTANARTNNQINTTSYATPTITTTNANDLILSIVITSAATTSPSWTTSSLFAPGPGTKWAIYFGQNIVSATQTSFSDTLSWTGNQGATALIAAFEAVPSATPTISYITYNPPFLS